jgi:hypothetical protein
MGASVVKAQKLGTKKCFLAWVCLGSQDYLFFGKLTLPRLRCVEEHEPYSFSLPVKRRQLAFGFAVTRL